MNMIRQSKIFTKWLAGLKDQVAKERVFARIRSAKMGNFGDHRFVVDGIWEMRIHYGAGYRLYYAQEGSSIYLLLMGGDKQSQSRDIEKAQDLWDTVKKRK